MIEGIMHSSISVSDLEKAIAFYRDVLGLNLRYIAGPFSGEEASKGVGVEGAKLKLAVLQADDDNVELIQYLAPKGKPFDRLPCDIGSMHVAFRVSDIQKMYDGLVKQGTKFNNPPIKHKKGPQEGWIWAAFNGPDGIQLELIEERSDSECKSAASSSSNMITAVHHTSISVSDIDKSIAFYRDALGLKLLFTVEGGGDTVKGGEKEISKGVGVEGAKLKLAVLQAGNALIELLQYVSPKGKPFDRLPCDIGSMHVAFRVSDIQKMYDGLVKQGTKFNTPPLLIKEGPEKGWLWCYFNDPDGVQLELVEPT